MCEKAQKRKALLSSYLQDFNWFFCHDEFLHLARCRHWIFIYEHDMLRDLVSGYLGKTRNELQLSHAKCPTNKKNTNYLIFTEQFDILRCSFMSIFQFDPSTHLFTKLIVGHSTNLMGTIRNLHLIKPMVYNYKCTLMQNCTYGCHQNSGMFVQKLLHFGRIDICPTSNDQLFCSTNNLDHTIRIHRRHISVSHKTQQVTTLNLIQANYISKLAIEHTQSNTSRPWSLRPSFRAHPNNLSWSYDLWPAIHLAGHGPPLDESLGR